MKKIVFVWSWKDNDDGCNDDISMNWAHIYDKNCVVHRLLHFIFIEPYKLEKWLSLFYRLGNWGKKD